MAGDTPFAVDLGKLRKKPKAVDDSQVEAVDRAAAEHGFVQREAGKKRGARRALALVSCMRRCFRTLRKRSRRKPGCEE
jgi:hypothetical protein